MAEDKQTSGSLRTPTRWRLVGGISVVVVVAATLAATTRGWSRPDTAPVALRAGVHTAARIGSAVQLVSNASPLRKRDEGGVAAVAAAEQRLAIKLLQQVNAPGNVSVSPASLYVALGMLQDGARGSTEQQIAEALQASGLDSREQNAGLAALTDELAAAARHAGISLESANSIWQQRGFPVRKQFLADLATYYRSGVWQADFVNHNADALNSINKWVSQHTRGKIDKLFDQLDRLTVLVLANAIYFHAAWATPFDGRETEPGKFIIAAGNHVTAKFMIGKDGLLSGAGPGYEAAQLPYEGGRFVALAVMPTSGSLADFTTALTPAKVDAMSASLQPGTQVALPRFITTSSTDLVPVLQHLGMQDAFSGACDLSGLSPIEGIQVGQVLQRVYLQVGEKGTTAAAVTGISVEFQSRTIPPPEVRFDHPFVFLIRDTKTGTILFASKIEEPTAS